MIAAAAAVLLVTGASAASANASDGGGKKAGKGAVCKVVAGHGGKGGKGGKGGVVVLKGSWQPPFDAGDLAKALHISQAKARALYAGLGKLAHGPRGTIDEGSPGFAAVAARAGVSPRQLAGALMKLKMAAGEKECRPAGKGKPGKPGEPGGSGKGDGGGSGSGSGKGDRGGKALTPR
jgi:hypothetical protein